MGPQDAPASESSGRAQGVGEASAARHPPLTERLLSAPHCIGGHKAAVSGLARPAAPRERPLKPAAGRAGQGAGLSPRTAGEGLTGKREAPRR